jgi:hypothetical protein
MASKLDKRQRAERKASVARNISNTRKVAANIAKMSDIIAEAKFFGVANYGKSAKDSRDLPQYGTRAYVQGETFADSGSAHGYLKRPTVKRFAVTQ